MDKERELVGSLGNFKRLNGLYLWSKIHSLKEGRYMKHDCLGGMREKKA